MKKKSIYIVQSYSGTIPAKVIKIITRYKYSHIMIAIDEKFDKLYSFGRRTVNNPLNCGFIIESKDGNFFKKFHDTECRIYRIDVDIDKFNNIVEILNEYESNPSKYDYDVIGLLLKLFKINIKRKNHYVCSQFVAEVIDRSAIYKFSKPIEAVEPRDFENIRGEVTYVGKLKDYNYAAR